MDFDDAYLRPDGPCFGVPAWLMAVSLVGAVLAAADKSQARAGGRRVPERAFHVLALLGGWPGLALAFLLVRHKTRKGRFLAPFILAAVANAVLLVTLARWLECA